MGHREAVKVDRVCRGCGKQVLWDEGAEMLVHKPEDYDGTHFVMVALEQKLVSTLLHAKQVWNGTKLRDRYESDDF